MDDQEGAAEPKTASWRASGAATRDPRPSAPKPDRQSAQDDDITKSLTKGTYEAVKGVQYGTVDFLQDVFGAPREERVSTFTEPLFKETAAGPEKLEVPEAFQKDVSYVAEVFRNMTYVDEGKILEQVRQEKEEMETQVNDLKAEVARLNEQLSKVEEMGSLESRSNQQIVFQSVQTIAQQEADEFGSFWFSLAQNTYGTAIWALLVLELDALDFRTVFSCNEHKCGRTDLVPDHQQFEKPICGCPLCIWDPWQWLSKRLWPFLNVSIFFVVGIGLFIVAFALQVGFIFYLDASLQMEVDLSNEGAEYICGTEGNLQLISVGFFISIVLGNIPQGLKTLLVIWFAHAETTEARGLQNQRYLYRVSRDKDPKRKREALKLEQDMAASAVAIADAKTKADTAREHLEQAKQALNLCVARQNQCSLEKAWCTGETQEMWAAKEEEAKATAQRAREKQEAFQNELDAAERAARDEKQKLARLKADEERAARAAEQGRSWAIHTVLRFCATMVQAAELFTTGYILYVGVRYIFWSGYTSLDPALMADGRFGTWDVTEDGKPDPGFGLPWMSNTNGVEEVLMATLALQFIMDIDELLFQNLLPQCIQKVVENTRFLSTKWMPGSMDEDMLKNLGQPMIPIDTVYKTDESTGKWTYQRQDRPRQDGYDLYQLYQSFWMTMIPFTTFLWIGINLIAAFIVVLFVRAEVGCARFEAVDMPEMPRNEDGSIIDDRQTGEMSDVLLWMIPVYVVAGLFTACTLKYCCVNYVLRGPGCLIQEVDVMGDVHDRNEETKVELKEAQDKQTEAAFQQAVPKADDNAAHKSVPKADDSVAHNSGLAATSPPNQQHLRPAVPAVNPNAYTGAGGPQGLEAPPTTNAMMPPVGVQPPMPPPPGQEPYAATGNGEAQPYTNGQMVFASEAEGAAGTGLSDGGAVFPANGAGGSIQVAAQEEEEPPTPRKVVKPPKEGF